MYICLYIYHAQGVPGRDAGPVEVVHIWIAHIYMCMDTYENIHRS